MAVQWGTFRTHIRRSILKDTDEDRWSNDQLLDFIGWALDTFCSHTAAVTATEITVVTGTLSYALPSNIFESPEDAGAVYTVNSSGVYTTYQPFFQNTDEGQQTAYYVDASNNIVFLKEPADSPVSLRYFAYWNHPVQDTDTIDVPGWALPALANLVGYYAVAPEFVAAGNIRRFAESPEKGDPLDNPFIQMQDQFMKTYNNLLSRFHPQQRNLIRVSNAHSN